MKEYLGLALNEAGNGCVTDLRFKLAVEFLKSTISAEGFDIEAAPALLAGLALNLSSALIAEGEKRGLIKALPEGLSDNDVAHMHRQAEAQVLGQLHGQKVAQDEQSRVVPIAGRFMNS